MVGLEQTLHSTEQGVLERFDVALARAGAKRIQYFPSIRVAVVEVPSPGDDALKRAAERLLAIGGDAIDYIEPNRCVYTEPSFAEVAALGVETCEDPWSLRKIDAKKAWNETPGNDKVVVAVIDTGAETDHPELEDQLWTNPCEQDDGDDNPCGDGRKNAKSDDLHGWNFLDKSSDIDDEDGHGTEVASVIAASHGQGSCGLGVSPDVSLMVLKALEGQSGYVDHLVGALDYAIAEGASVVNASWSTDKDSSLERALRSAQTAGVVVVTAAGKNGVATDLDSNPWYPCSFENLSNLICVTGTDDKDQRETFSSFGDETVHMGAPGDAICTATRQGGCAHRRGPSLAAPHVTGVAALIREKCRCATVGEITERIRYGSDDALPGETIWHKRLNAGGALSGACRSQCPHP